MSRGSFGRTVARAAASGGSKNYKARPPVLWYVAITLIVVVGVGLIAYSRNEAVHRASASSTAPTASDNWYTAIGFDVCGTLQQPLPANTNLTTAGIRTFGDGIINTNPGSVANSSAYTGANATLGTFVSNYGHGLTIAPTVLALPLRSAVTSTTTTTTLPTATTSPTSPKSATTATTSPKSASTATTSAASSSTRSKGTVTKARGASKAKGASTSRARPKPKGTTSAVPKVSAPPVHRYPSGMRCTSGPDAGKAATVQVETWSSPTSTGTRVSGDPAGIRLTNGGMVTVAVVPAGSAIPEPGSKSTLLQDLGKK